MSLVVVPITLHEAKSFVLQHHRHSNPPHGQKFAIGVRNGGVDLVGVAVTGRPSARPLDDGLTIEVTRTCTDGTRNANSKLYGAAWAAARAMGYRRGVTYTEEGESGASLRAVGWKPVAELPARSDWAASSVKLRHLREPAQATLLDAPKKTGGKARIRWEIRA